ncbi:hypothetical protein [Geminocystis sp. NIES-3709]|uniref:hypothetical protein n=1 Tax=Geminocystis sp. NIES-3709 TaxID=1617448 RepID=UPI0005FCBA6D|nr:hypothetical protein [Geminocystis sp. NIES-3709]BAQ66962.1 predicted protein [Geminocystis sp. NIES-3709]
MTNITCLEAFNQFSELHSQGKVNNVRSALFRYYGKGLEERKTEKARFNKEMMKRMERRLAKVEINDQFNRDQFIKILEKGFDLLEIKPKQRNPIRSHLNTFLRFIEEKILNRNQVKNEEKPYSPRNKIIDKSYIEKSKAKRKQKPKIALEDNPEFYLDRLEEKYPEKNKKELIEIAKNSLKNLEEEYNNFTKYHKLQKVRLITIKSHLCRLGRLLGWYYQHNPITIEELNLQSIIKVIDTKVDREEYGYDMNEIYIVEGKARDKAKSEAKKLIKFIDNFLIEYEVKTLTTAKHYVESLISVSKFLYRDITDIAEADNFEDIIVMRYLRAKVRKVKETFSNLQPEKLPLDWKEVKQVIDAYRLDANLEYYERFSNVNGKKTIRRSDKKTPIARAQNLQNFLILALFTVNTPDRQRTIRELEYGRTLKYGKLDNNGFLIPLQPMEDKAQEGRYFLDQKPEDHKLGDKSRFFAINNPRYEDGTYFYDYLNKWLFQGFRDILAQPTTKTVFVRAKTGLPYESKEMSSKVGYLFKKKTGVSIGPHKLRNIFVTYLANSNATDAERRAAAFQMNHSLEIADKTYNNQTDMERIKPIQEWLERQNN